MLALWYICLKKTRAMTAKKQHFEDWTIKFCFKRSQKWHNPSVHYTIYKIPRYPQFWVIMAPLEIPRPPLRDLNHSVFLWCGKVHSPVKPLTGTDPGGGGGYMGHDQGCARLRFFGMTRLWLMWQSRWLNSDSTQHFTFLDWLNTDSTQIPNLLTWLTKFITFCLI